LIERDAFLVPKYNVICQLCHTPEICTRASQLSILQVLKNWEGGRNKANRLTNLHFMHYLTQQVYICNQREYVQAHS